MRRIWWYLLACIVIVAAVLTALWLRPSQEEQIAALRRQSNRYLVITRDMFVDNLAPWRARRESQGFQVVVHSWHVSPSFAEVKQWIRTELKQSGGLCRYILLVGDCAAAGEESAAWHLPAFVGSMGYQYEKGEPARHIVGDAPYGDIDNDGRQEAAVGRLPVRTLSQLSLQIEKIIQYEAMRPQPSYYRAVLWTGAKHHHQPMYRTTLQFIDTMLPAWLYPYVISSYTPSVCSGPLTGQPGQFLSALARPAFLSLMVGHGDYNNLRCAEINGEEIRMVPDTVAGLKSDTAVGPLILLACDAGSYHLPTEMGPSMAEVFLDRPGGPVAVIAAAGYLNVLTNFYMAGSLAGHIAGDSATIGDLLVDSRQILYEIGRYTLRQIREHDPRTHALLGPPDGEHQELYDIKHLIRDESLLFNLLGDPCLALNKPLPLQIRIERIGNHRLRLSGETPPETDALWVEYFDLNRLHALAPRDITDDQRRRLFQEANQPPRLLAHQLLDGRPWQVDLAFSDRQIGPGRKVRVMAMGKNQPYYYTIDLGSDLWNE